MAIRDVVFGNGQTVKINDWTSSHLESPRWSVKYAGVRKKRGQWYVGVKRTLYWNSFAPSFSYTVLEKNTREWVPIAANSASEAVRIGQAYVGVGVQD